MAADVDPIKTYRICRIMAKNKDPFAKSHGRKFLLLYNSEDGLTRVGDKWSEYVDTLQQKITLDESAGQPDLDDSSCRSETALHLEGGKDSRENFQAAYLELEKYKAMIVRRSDIRFCNLALAAMFKAPGEVTGDRLAHRLTYLRNNGILYIRMPCGISVQDPRVI